MGICPECKALYPDDIIICPDCRAILEEETETEPVELVEIYVTFNDIEANFLVSLLGEQGIIAAIRDMTITPYPMKIAPFCEKRVQVEKDKRDIAVEIIRRAWEDGLLSPDGYFSNEG